MNFERDIAKLRRDSFHLAHVLVALSLLFRNLKFSNRFLKMVILCYQSMDRESKMVPIGFVIIRVHVLYFQLISPKFIKFHYHHQSVDFFFLTLLFRFQFD